MYNFNPILNSDSYKLSHFKFYPEGTTNVYSYMESRGGRYEKNLFFGLQGLIKQYLLNPVKRSDVKYAKQFAEAHGMPFNEKGWNRIVNKHGGYYPVEIKAVPEGTLVPTKNVLMTVENTDPEVPFITSYIETMALRLWYPITVATRGYYMKNNVKPFFDVTSDAGNLDFSILDFSARGTTSYESNLIGGAAHLLNFSGSDSMAAVDYVKRFYGGEILGYSVPATEHSIMTAYGHDNELESFRRLLDITPPNSTLSVVSDTWNIFDACEKWVSLKDIIFAKNITLVIRPDSGDIATVLDKVFIILLEGFGYTVNDKGYAVLNNVKVLWGDGMNENTIGTPYSAAMLHNISADSVMAGSGGGLLQADMDRDTSKFAFKASNIKINGVDKPIAKDPITDPGKQSKQGRMKLVLENGEYATVTDSNSSYNSANDQLRTIYKNGELLIDESMTTIRERVK